MLAMVLIASDVVDYANVHGLPGHHARWMTWVGGQGGGDMLFSSAVMVSYPSGLRERSAKPSFSGSNPLDTSRHRRQRCFAVPFL